MKQSVAASGLRIAAALTFVVMAVSACGSSDSDSTAASTTVAPSDSANAVAPSIEAELIVEAGTVSVDGVEISVGSVSPVDLGEQIVAGDGARGLVRLGDHYQFELFLGSNFRLVSSERLELVAFLDSGHLRFAADEQGEARLRLDTSNAVLTTLDRGTEFTVCQAPTGLTCLNVVRGEVEWLGGGATETFVASQSSFAEMDAPPGAAVCVPVDVYQDWFEGARRNEDVVPLAGLVDQWTSCVDGDSDEQEAGIGAFSDIRIPTSVGMVRVAADGPAIGTADYVAAPENYREPAVLDSSVDVFIDAQAVSNEEYRAWLVSAAGDEPAQWRELAPDRWLSDAPGGAATQATFLAGDAEAPVRGVRPQNAEAFCVFTDKRLPTETEWEVAATSGALEDLGTVREWVSDWDDYGPGVASGAQVLRGKNDLLESDPYFRFILVDEADRPVARADAGFRCAANDVVEPTDGGQITGDTVFDEDFCSFENDWLLLAGEGFDLGYHPSCFYHVESSRPHAQVAVMSGSAVADLAAVETAVRIRNTADSTGNFRYGILVGSADSGYLVFTVQPGRDGDAFFLDWCLQAPSETLIAVLEESGQYAALAPEEPSDDRHAGETCAEGVASGKVDVTSFESTFSLRGSEESVTLAIDGLDVGEAPVSMPSGDFGLFVQTYHMPLAHLHFDRITATSA